MTLFSTESPEFTARLAGALWLIVIVLSIASIFVNPSVTTAGTPSQTAVTVLATETAYRLAFALLFVGSLCRKLYRILEEKRCFDKVYDKGCRQS